MPIFKRPVPSVRFGQKRNIHRFPASYTFFHERPLLPREERMRKVADILGLSKAAKTRLEWMLWYEAHGGNAQLTARHFGISRKTFHLWRGRYAEDNLRTLESGFSAPKNRRTPVISAEEEVRVIALKRAHLSWGKRKIQALYETTYGVRLSEWKIQRLITRHQLYQDPKKVRRSAAKRLRSRHKHRITELAVQPRFGFLLCLDTVTVYATGVKRTIFTAIDRYSKLAYARMYRSKSTVNSRDFLLRLHHLLDGKVERVGHDNGSEFQGEFAKTCEKLAVPQFHSRVRTPKDNAVNERFNRTLQEEFVNQGNLAQDPDLFNAKLTPWLIEYNFQRPHQSLGYLSPMSFIQKIPEVTPTWSSSTPSCLFSTKKRTHGAAAASSAD